MPQTPTVAPKLAGRTVAFAGTIGYRNSQREPLTKLATAEGARVVDPDAVVPDVLVTGTGKPPAVVAKVRKKNPAVAVVDVSGFYKLLAYTADEFLAVLRAGPYDWQTWSDMYDRVRASAPIDLSGVVLKGEELTNSRFTDVTLDGADLRGARLESAHFGKLRSVQLDGATMRGGYTSDAEDCSFKDVDLAGGRFNPAQFARCDFSGATLARVSGSFTQAAGCAFRQADLTDGGFEQSNFAGSDFRWAKFAGAKFEKSDFTGADLTGVNAAGGDFRGAKFVTADLTKADFRGANLAGCDLTGATIDGADFTGANLSGVVADGVEASKAKEFAPTAARTPGPRMNELARVARQSKRLDVSIELGLTGKEYVSLTASVVTYGASAQYYGAHHTHYRDDGTSGVHAGAQSLEQGMLTLVDLWSKGVPRLETATATAKGCPLKPKELRALAREAWCEALGVAAPTAGEWKQRDEEKASAAAELRETMLADLRKGSDGVKRFNARTDKEREALGKLHKLDLTRADLTRARLHGLDLQRTVFDAAALAEANLHGAKLQGARFFNAKAGGANFAGCKASETYFVAATLTGCNLRMADLRGANFKSADLTESQFHYSDLRGTDFTLANLTKTNFDQARFDATTVFPDGFVPPADMLWCGDGPHPGKLSAVETSATGSMDFATFVKGLNDKIEAARVEKVAAMLKAERFQLFADVTDSAVTGVVKSQTSDDLLYSCRLAADGQFGCGTQNAKPCGGLRGSLCKHLLVLVVGLVKAGKLDAATADNWINTSTIHRPVLDKESLAETFFKYKGYEAGEIDWRPTETVPEDFYAM